MSAGNGDIKRPDEPRLQVAVSRLADPEARDAFASRLKREFVAGTLQPAGRRAAPGPVWRRRLALPGLVAAAAVAALLALFVLDQGPRWQVMSPAPAGELLVGETRMPLTDVAAIEAQLRPGVRVAWEDTTAVTLLAQDQLAIQLSPESALRLPATPGRWLRRNLQAHVLSGEVRFTSAPAFRGAQLLITTDTARIEMTGTTIAVIETAEMTCVCVYEGSARIGPLEGALERVPPGKRKIIYRDGRQVLQDIFPMERMKLQMLDEAIFPDSLAGGRSR